MRGFTTVVAAILVTLGALSLSAPAPAQSGDADKIRDQLASLGAEIEQVDAKLADIGKQRAALQAKVDAYGKTIESNKSAAQELRERDAHLATRRQQLEAEHKAAAELCSRKVADREYKALVAKCEAAGAAYRHHAEELQREYDKVVEAHAKYEAEIKQLDGEHKELEQQRDAVQQAQSSLGADRDRLVKAFNDARGRLLALKDKPDGPPRQ